MSDEVPEDLNAAVLLDIDTELSTNGDKPCDAEILAEVGGKVIQGEEEDDVDVVYDEPPASESVFQIEKAIEVLQQLTLLWDEGDDVQEVLSKVNAFTKRYSKKKETKNYQRLL